MNRRVILYIILIQTKAYSQNNISHFPKFSGGFTHSTFTSLTLLSLPNLLQISKERHPLTTSKIAETQYGFGFGFFLWMPLNDGVVYKPKIDCNFTNYKLNNTCFVYATSFDVSINHSFCIALTSPNKNGVIYLAKNMSCYLTTKQPYIIVGPKINLKKYDKGFLHKGFENELSFGLSIGYGINYEFHGTNFAPEICYSLTSTGQNQINDSKKMAHTITLAFNFF